MKLAEGPDNKETRDRAMLVFYRLMAEVLSNPPVDGGNPTVASICDAHLAFAARHDAHSTFYERKLLLQKFCDTYGPVRVKKLIPYHLTEWVNSQATWDSNWTRAYAIRIVKRAFNWAAKAGLIPESPFAKVELPSCEKRRRPLTEAEYQTLVGAAGPESRMGEILMFVCLTGCRPGELRSLLWEEVELDDPHPHFTEWKHKTSGRQRRPRPRTVFLVPELVALLAMIRARQDDSTFVFVSHRGRQWARCSIQQRLRRLRRKIGLPEDVVLYCLRHKFGTDSIVRGNDIKTTGDLMGHTDTRMTEYYVELAAHPAHLAGAMVRATKSP